MLLTQDWHRDKISRQHGQIWIEAVRYLDRSLDGMNGKVRVVMKIAQLRNGKTIEFLGKPGQEDFNPCQLRVVGLNESRIGSQRYRTHRCERRTSL